MSELEQVPTLTLDFEEAVQQATAAPAAPAAPTLTAAAPAQVQQAAPAEPPEPVLSPAEEKAVQEFLPKIELSNSSVIVQYGSGAQKKIADFSENVLSTVRTKDLGEVGQILTDVVTQLKDFDVEEEEKGFFGFFKRSANKMTALKAKYDKAEANVNRICEVLESHQVQLLPLYHRRKAETQRGPGGRACPADAESLPKRPAGGRPGGQRFERYVRPV